MAANDYYKGHPNNQYLNEPPSFSRPSYAQNPYSSQSPVVTPLESQEHIVPSPSQSSYHALSPLDGQAPHQEQIPLKQTSKIQTNPDKWQVQTTHYPLSPDGQMPLDPAAPAKKRRSKKKKGFFAGPIPWVVYTMTVAQLTVFIVEIARNSVLTGSPIMIQPQFNPMIGPSTQVLINMGARFVPCMRTTPGVTSNMLWACPNSTTTDPNSSMNQCSLADVCGMSGLDFNAPNQWYRFIVPMFLHAGLIHISFNLLLQLTMGREMERIIGSIRFALVYISSGIFGFVLGGNLAPPAIASTGASGSLFGILALVLLDLLYSWQERASPVKDLLWILLDIIISFVLGLLPGLDNFSHIGGFLMGLVLGVCILHSPKALRQRIGDSGPYRTLSNNSRAMMSGGIGDRSSMSVKSPIEPSAPGAVDYSQFAKKPIGFFKGRKPLWWAWWLVRAGALIGVLIGFIVLLTNFYKYRTTCGWCKYLSCLPIKNWCELGNLTVQNTNTNGTNSRRDLIAAGAALIGATMKP